MSEALNNTLRVTQQLLNSSKDSEQVPIGVRHSLELVNICDRDLRVLIELRDENLDFLEKQPAELIRVNTVIEKAYQGLAEVCKIIDNCRPDVYNSRTPLRKRVRWFLVDSREFQSLEPVISCQHAAVLSELSFLRQIALWAPSGSRNDESLVRGEGLNQTAQPFDNIGLLGDILGGISDPFQNAGPSPVVRPADTLQYHQALHTNVNHASISFASGMASPPASRAPILARSRDSLASMPLFEEKQVVEAYKQSTPDNKRTVVDSSNDDGLSLLFDDWGQDTPRPPSSVAGQTINYSGPGQISPSTQSIKSATEATEAGSDTFGPYGSLQPSTSTLTLSSASLVSQEELGQQRRPLLTRPFGALHHISSSSQMSNLGLDYVRANSTTPWSTRRNPQSQIYPAQAIELDAVACCDHSALPRHSETIAELSAEKASSPLTELPG